MVKICKICKERKKIKERLIRKYVYNEAVDRWRKWRKKVSECPTCAGGVASFYNQFTDTHYHSCEKCRYESEEYKGRYEDTIIHYYEKKCEVCGEKMHADTFCQCKKPKLVKDISNLALALAFVFSLKFL